MAWTRETYPVHTRKFNCKQASANAFAALHGHAGISVLDAIPAWGESSAEPAGWKARWLLRQASHVLFLLRIALELQGFSSSVPHLPRSLQRSSAWAPAGIFASVEDFKLSKGLRAFHRAGRTHAIPDKAWRFARFS